MANLTELIEKSFAILSISSTLGMAGIYFLASDLYQRNDFLEYLATLAICVDIKDFNKKEIELIEKYPLLNH
ncbi:MAG: hypothetical protein ABIA37_02195 [Candidatus Woesearchaeota archaeon]